MTSPNTTPFVECHEADWSMEKGLFGLVVARARVAGFDATINPSGLLLSEHFDRTTSALVALVTGFPARKEKEDITRAKIEKASNNGIPTALFTIGTGPEIVASNTRASARSRMRQPLPATAFGIRMNQFYAKNIEPAVDDLVIWLASLATPAAET